jgi:hypothetical protein
MIEQIQGTTMTETEGFIYLKVTDVLPAFKTLSGIDPLIGLVKIGKARNLATRDKGYRLYLPMLFDTVFAVRVQDRHVAEQLILSHFQSYNVRREFDASAQQKMSSELARVAKMVGVECFRIDVQAVKDVMLLIGDEVTSERKELTNVTDK